MKLHLRNGMSVETNMAHGDFTDLMQDDNFDFVVVPYSCNENTLYNIRKEAIDVIEVNEEEQWAAQVG